MLSQNAIQNINNGRTDFQPTLQVVQVKQIAVKTQAPSTQPARYRLLVSDGTHYQQAMGAQQLNQMIVDQVVAENCIVKLTEWLCNKVKERKIIIVLKLEVVQGPQPKIGNPVNIEGGHKQAAAGGGASAGYTPSAPVNNPYQQRSAPVVRTDPGIQTYPISALNPYQGRWTIKARVTSKSDIRTWNNARGEGKLFSIDLLDAAGTEIRATFFRDAVDKFEPMIQENGVYYFSNGRIKIANKKFTSIPNDYEINFGGDAEVRPAEDDQRISRQMFNFVPLADLAQAAVNTTVDVLCIVKSAYELKSLTSKDGRAFDKRDMMLVDSSKTLVRITLWNNKARDDKPAYSNQAVVAFKGAKVSEFNGRTLNTLGSTNITINPDIPEAHALRQWYDNGGKNETLTSLSGSGEGGGSSNSVDSRRTFSSIKDQGLGFGPKPDYITVKGTISFIRNENMWYPACPVDVDGRSCNKKAIENGGTWNCVRCNRDIVPVNRYILSVTATDHTGSTWLTCFNDSGASLLGKSADEMQALQSSDLASFEALTQQCTFQQFIMRIRVKAQEHNDEMKVKSAVQSLRPIDYKQESRALLDAIAKYN